MAALKYVMTIPSVDIGGFISIDDLTLIGSEDERYRELQTQNPVMAKYLSAFRAPDGTSVHPSVVVRDASLPKVDTQRLCSFRNAIAVASVLYSRTEHYRMNTPLGVYCTDMFDFYAVSVSADGTDLIGRTPYEISAWMQVDDFAGSTTPSVIHPQNTRVVFDEWLMLWLLNLLEIRSRRRSDVQFVNRIFRSIELAYYALRAPIVNLQARADFGVALSLWVSAFEALAHPGAGDVHYSDVSSLIEETPWQHHRLRRKAYANIARSKKSQKSRLKVTLPMQVYARLYYSRNKYAHGNPLPKGQFEFVRRRNWGNLWFQVPALYRSVLCYALATKGSVARPTFSDPLNYAYEEALLKRPAQET